MIDLNTVKHLDKVFWVDRVGELPIEGDVVHVFPETVWIRVGLSIWKKINLGEWFPSKVEAYAYQIEVCTKYQNMLPRLRENLQRAALESDDNE